MKKNRVRGFTLLELLVVVIVVGILAAVALPQFGRMTQRARFAEGQNMVGAILTAELVYYQERATFTNTLTELLVDYPADGVTGSNFNYAGSGAAAANVTVTATGRGAAAGLTVTGTVTNTGTRTMTRSPAT